MNLNQAVDKRLKLRWLAITAGVIVVGGTLSFETVQAEEPTRTKHTRSPVQMRHLEKITAESLGRIVRYGPAAYSRSVPSIAQQPVTSPVTADAAVSVLHVPTPTATTAPVGATDALTKPPKSYPLQGPNLLANPDFEAPILDGQTPGPAGNWEVNTPMVTRQSSVVRSDSYALGIQGPAATNWLAGNQDVLWNAGDPVYASVWIKTNLPPLSGLRAGLLIEFIGDPTATSPVLGSLKREVAGTNDWRLLEVTSSAPAGTQQVRMHLYLWSDTISVPDVQVYFDDAVLEQTLQQPQPQTTLLNPDFENALHDWTQGGTLAVVTTSPVYQGVYAAQSTVDDVAAGYWSQLFQEISYGASQPLHFKAQVKTTLAVTSQAKAGVLVEFFDAAKNKVGEVKNEVGGTQDWQPVEVFATTPAATSSVRVSVSLWTPAGDSASLGGTATFDTCVLDDATQPPPPPVSLGLSNPNFEQGLVDWLPNGEPFTTTGASGFHYDDPPLNPGKLAATTRVNSVASDFWSAIYQERSVAAGDPVYASARFRITLSPLAQAKAGVLLQFLDANQAIVGEFKREIGGTQGWRIVQTAGTAPPTATLVRYYLYLFAPQDDTLAVGGEAFYDRCLLEQSTRQPPPQIRPYNLGFKNGLYDWLVTVPSGGRQPPQVSATVFRSGGFLHARSLSGIYAATDTIEPDLSGYWSAVFQEINAPTWPFFYGRVFIQTENLDQGEAGLLLQYLDQNNQIIIEEKRGVTGTLPWTLVEITTQPPAGAVKLRYSCYLYGSSLATGGTAYFDDAHYMVGYTADDVGPFW